MRSFVLPLILMAAAGCGGDDGDNKIDAGMSDSPAPDANLGAPVTLTIKADGVGVAAVHVHFQNPDSTLIISKDTDANGVVSSPMPTGGYVTAINAFAAQSGAVYLNTFSAVQPGDALALDNDTSTLTITTVSGPRDADVSVTAYLASTPCDNSTGLQVAPGNPSVVGNVNLDVQCKPTTDLLMASLDVNGDPVHYGYLANVAVNGAAVNATALALTSVPVSKTFTFTNVPGGGGAMINFEQHHTTARGSVVTWGGSGTGTSPVITRPVTPITGALDLVEAKMPTTYGQRLFVDWTSTFSATYAADVSTKIIKKATSLATFDAATHRIGWTQEATGLDADWAISATSAHRTSANLDVFWEITAPVTDGSVQYPTLPVETVDYNIQPTDQTNPLGDDIVIAGKTPGGYAAVRETLPSFVNSQGPIAVVSGPSGTASLQLIRPGANNMLATGKTPFKAPARLRWAHARKSD